MKSITLLRLSYSNFKGQTFEVEPSKLTEISGDNRLGKTTCADAFNWLLFGKDSQGKADFDIKPFDAANKVIHRLNPEVEGLFDIDGTHVKLKRIYKEIWRKKQGNETAELTGHEQDLFIDDVPYKLGDYQKYVSDIIDESTFRMLTGAHYFTSLKWELQRSTLIQMAGGIDDNEIAQGNPEFVNLIAELSGKTIENYNKQIAGEIKPIKDELKQIPARIDEVQKSKPEPIVENRVQALLNEKEAALKAVDDKIADVGKAYTEEYTKVEAAQNEKFGLETKLRALNNELTASYDNELSGYRKHKTEIEQSITTANDGIITLKKSIESNDGQIQNLVAINDGLRNRIAEINNRTFEFTASKTCTSCGQDLPSEDIDKLKQNALTAFNQNKISDANDANATGVGNKEKIENFQSSNTDLQSSITQFESDLEKLAIQLNSISETIATKEAAKPSPTDAIIALEKQIKEFVMPEVAPPNNEDLKKEKEGYQKEVDELKKELAKVETIKSADKRIDELKDNERKLNAQLAGLEKKVFIMAQFSAAKIKSIEDKINSMFSFVKFKLFNELLNGGVEECCIALKDGVPYPSVNSAGKIQIGLDIITALQKKYNVSAPIWIDNIESVNELPTMDCQVITLRVTGEQKLSVKHF